MLKDKFIKEEKRLINSFKYAINGFFVAFKSEKNMVIHTFASLLVIILGLILNISLIEWCICLIMIAIVISAELINTSIETVTDMITLKEDRNAKRAKDVAACSVFVLAFISAIIGLIIFGPKLLALI